MPLFPLSRRIAGAALAGVLAAHAVPVQAQEGDIASRSSFRVGDSGVVCTAQYNAADARLQSMFDRAYRVTCRDAAAPVADALVLRTDRETDTAAVAQSLIADLQCEAPAQEQLPAGGSAEVLRCTDPASGVAYLRYRAEQGRQIYLVRSLAGYASAARLALAALMADRPVAGKVEVATTAAGDPAAFARVRAGALDEASARTQAYELNRSGSFSDANAFFESLAERQPADPSRGAEFVANQGLQQSNLGNFAVADSLLERASRLVPRSDGVTQRLIRNYRAINLLNQRLGPEALEALQAPVASPDERLDLGGIGSGVIAEQLAREINRENAGLRQLGAVASGLTQVERAAILDAQADQLRGSAYRLTGQLEEAKEAIRSANRQFDTVRDGRVASTAAHRLQSQHELALILEAQGEIDEARSALQEGLEYLERTYPLTPAPVFARSWLAGFEARHGRDDAALALYREVVDASLEIPEAREAIKDILPGYFELLGRRLDSDPGAGAELYRAAQLLQRPGVAQTQAVLARELSSGSGEAASLFRLSLARSRAIARTSADIASLTALGELSDSGARQLAEAQETLQELQREQTELQSRLAAFPQYRSLASTELPLADLQALLRPGEAYYKLSIVGSDSYAQLIGPDYLRSFRLDADRATLDRLVSLIRASISVEENGKRVTYPFDIESARELYLILFGPVEKELGRVKHLIYEPDGALLQLPPTLLPVDQRSVDVYLKRTERIDSDVYDFRGVEWLGRDVAVSVSVSQRSFADLRTIAPSQAKRAYLGLGENAIPRPQLQQAVLKDRASSAEPGCEWPLATWQNPISADELRLGRSLLGQGASDVVTGEAFSDTALLAREDLGDYRIVHFATHGLVTAPRPSCPSRPALVTSFGPLDTSDGLLGFAEIFDLRFDADLVILSACDTAGAASVAATREAGVETGGDYALDGLVRAFTGAGVRSVLASHWPVPDDFNATNRLISGLLRSGESAGVAEALHRSTLPLMDEAATSHPYYWAAFILVGDGSKTLR